MRQITEDQAYEALKILIQECGHKIFRSYDSYSFVRAITGDCREYRFMGSLGFGGKFCNNGNRDNTPYVDCYPEHETHERLAMIEAANRRLDALFNPPTIQGKTP